MEDHQVVAMEQTIVVVIIHLTAAMEQTIVAAIIHLTAVTVPIIAAVENKYIKSNAYFNLICEF